MAPGFKIAAIQASVRVIWHDYREFVHHEDPSAAKPQPKSET